MIFENKKAAAVMIWWVLILIYASLRFDDGIHVAPTSLQMSDDVLLGVVWQTKVDRKRRRHQVRSASWFYFRHGVAEDGLGDLPANGDGS